jgi:hypothetical protein
MLSPIIKSKHKQPKEEGNQMKEIEFFGTGSFLKNH